MNTTVQVNTLKRLPADCKDVGRASGEDWPQIPEFGSVQTIK